MSSTPHQPCPFTSCGSSDAFNWDEGFGFCHSCNEGYPSNKRLTTFDWVGDAYPLKDKKVIMNKEPSSSTYKGIRGIDPEVCKFYGIQLQLDENDKPIRYAFRHTGNVKYRGYHEKKFWLKDTGSPILKLFGPEFNAGTSKMVYITEGEFDAASLFQILGGPSRPFPVMSLPSASISKDFIKNNYEYLKSFEKIIYAGELDKAGRIAADRLYKVFPSTFYYIRMSKWKDANEFLMEGDGDDLRWSAHKPQRYTPNNFFIGNDAIEKAITEENPYETVPTGHTGWDSKLRGLVKGGVTFIKAERGQGKTEIIRYLEMGLLSNPNTKVAMLHGEEMKSSTYRAMATYKLGKNVRTKEDALQNGVSEAEVVAAAKVMADDDRTIVFEMRDSDDPSAILDYIRLSASVYGADFIFVDHIQRLAYLAEGGVENATGVLTTIGARAAQLAKELNIGVIFISQVNTEGTTKYAAALEEEAIISVILSRDKTNDDERISNTTHLFCDKNRPFGKEGDLGSLLYGTESTILKEVLFEDV